MVSANLPGISIFSINLPIQKCSLILSIHTVIGTSEAVHGLLLWKLSTRVPIFLPSTSDLSLELREPRAFQVDTN